jgi:hypothetical protein
MSDLAFEHMPTEHVYLVFQRTTNDAMIVIGSLHRDASFRARKKRERRNTYLDLKAEHQRNQPWVFDAHADVCLTQAALQRLVDALGMLNRGDML